MAQLGADFGVGFECFASPMNRRHARFCSAFADTDAPFGSSGNFFSVARSGGLRGVRSAEQSAGRRTTTESWRWRCGRSTPSSPAGRRAAPAASSSSFRTGARRSRPTLCAPPRRARTSRTSSSCRRRSTGTSTASSTSPRAPRPATCSARRARFLSFCRTRPARGLGPCARRRCSGNGASGTSARGARPSRRPPAIGRPTLPRRFESLPTAPLPTAQSVRPTLPKVPSPCPTPPPSRRRARSSASTSRCLVRARWAGTATSRRCCGASARSTAAPAARRAEAAATMRSPTTRTRGARCGGGRLTQRRCAPPRGPRREPPRGDSAPAPEASRAWWRLSCALGRRERRRATPPPMH
mmetsp:Transcript_38388/g.126724  ORF Transcript_38388/g.126724 Transcript_38388/m.126724 type:complete len:355 (-) Transcript_38388:208-1272(-)